MSLILTLEQDGTVYLKLREDIPAGTVLKIFVNELKIKDKNVQIGFTVPDAFQIMRSEVIQKTGIDAVKNYLNDPEFFLDKKSKREQPREHPKVAEAIIRNRAEDLEANSKSAG